MLLILDKLNIIAEDLSIEELILKYEQCTDKVTPKIKVVTYNSINMTWQDWKQVSYDLPADMQVSSLYFADTMNLLIKIIKYDNQ